MVVIFLTNIEIEITFEPNPRFPYSSFSFFFFLSSNAHNAPRALATIIKISCGHLGQWEFIWLPNTFCMQFLFVIYCSSLHSVPLQRRKVSDFSIFQSWKVLGKKKKEWKNVSVSKLLSFWSFNKITIMKLIEISKVFCTLTYLKRWTTFASSTAGIATFDN